MSHKKIIALSAILAISLALICACKKGEKQQKTQAAGKAAQQMETPTLGPPLGETVAQKPPEPAKVEQAGALTLQAPQPPAPPPQETPPAAIQPAPPAAPLPTPPAMQPQQPPAAQPPLAQPQPSLQPPSAPPQLPALPAPAAPKAATPEIAQPVPFVPTMVQAETNVEVVLDASGSQTAPLGGVSKFDIQKNALRDIILQFKQAEFPRNIGIRVFGSQKPIDQHDCTDTTQIYPMGGADLDAISKALMPLTAQGEGPIAAALEAASKDLPASGIDQVIVLVADGADTCGVDPCQTAKAIHMTNPKIIIHVVGFDLSQEDEAKIKCIADNAEGRFYLARNENELRKSLDEAVNSTIPYNLRLTTVAGATPISTTITIFRGGTDQAIKKETSFGTKALRLAPGSYDILVEYTSSPEIKKPSKIIKGVEVLEKTKVEQEINFELGSLSLSSIDTYGKLSGAHYQIMKGPEKIVEIDGGAETTSFFLSPGIYDISAEQDKLTLTEPGIEIKAGEAVEKTFRFQKGTLALKGMTTQNVAIPFVYQIFKAGGEQLVASGAMAADGGSIPLSPGSYDIMVIGQDPVMMVNPRTKVAGVVITAAETNDLTANFEMGTVKLSAVDGQGNPVQAEFIVRSATTQEELARAKMADAKTPVSIPIPPGIYEITASSTLQVIEPKPTVVIPAVEVTAATPVERVAKFVFGTVRVRGRNAKEQPLETHFTIYRGGTDEVVASAPPSADWLAFQITPGHYDIMAENTTAEGEPKPTQWLKDIVVEDGKQGSYEAIFTAGKLKVIGRGPNNKIITCHFKVYQYGADTELINGDTGEDWQVFDIAPGNYYLEAGYVDPVQSVMLKKWINVKVGENEVLELILRF